MANLITCCRISGSLLLLFVPAFSPWFYVLYLICGLTDMIDGTVARKTNTVSAFGAKLDTAADVLFAGVCLLKLLPVLHMPDWLWTWIALIAAMKLFNTVLGFICQKRFVAEHTTINKVVGLSLFLLPLTIHFVDLRYSACAACLLATIAAIQEGYLIRAGKEIT